MVSDWAVGGFGNGVLAILVVEFEMGTHAAKYIYFSERDGMSCGVEAPLN